MGDSAGLSAIAHGGPRGLDRAARRQSGVYYTPPWVTSLLVEETLGALIGELRRRHGVDDMTHDRIGRLDDYSHELSTLKVVDPSCGEGAFLVAARDRLVRERIFVDEARRRGGGDVGAITRSVVRHSLYGIDIDLDAVAAARRALSRQAFTSSEPDDLLEKHVRCGDALVVAQADEPSGDARTFTWEAAFPEVLRRPGGRAGFDCVLGNPPYVRLHYVHKFDAEVVARLKGARRPDGSPVYESAQAPGLDLYLPFIERGIELLNDQGRMGYIAPSAWLVNEYGRGLREKVRRAQCLEGWVDLKDAQVFAGARTYTALQLFRKGPQRVITLRSPTTIDREGSVRVARTEASSISYASLSARGPWIFVSPSERSLLDRLSRACDRLGDLPGCLIGFRGVESGKDDLFHFRRVGEGRFVRARGEARRGGPGSEGEIQLDEALMRPLASGNDIKRYAAREPTLWILFPYDVEGEPRLVDAATMAARYAATWDYLKRHERELRARERGRMDRDDRFWGYNYPKNLKRHRLPKIGVPQTVRRLSAFYDSVGSMYFNNVRVGGILAPTEAFAWFLLGVLNGPVADFAWRSGGARPKRGGYYEANKQFLAPLPVPRATAAQIERAGEAARALQGLHSERRRIEDSPVRGQESTRAELTRLIAAIEGAEAVMSEMLFALYGLTRGERRLVERPSSAGEGGAPTSATLTAGEPAARP